MLSIKVFDQTTYSDKAAGTYGDCTRACVRTLAQAEMPDLPHPIAGTGEWNLDFFEVLESRYNLMLNCNPMRPDKDFGFLPRVVLAGGPTVRTGPEGKPSHMVVWDREANRCLHDPHPSRAGLTSVDMLYWLDPVED